MQLSNFQTYYICFSLYTLPVNYSGKILLSLYKWGNWELNKLCNLSQDTVLISGRAANLMITWDIPPEIPLGKSQDPRLPPPQKKTHTLGAAIADITVRIGLGVCPDNRDLILSSSNKEHNFMVFPENPYILRGHRVTQGTKTPNKRRVQPSSSPVPPFFKDNLITH